MIEIDIPRFEGMNQGITAIQHLDAPARLKVWSIKERGIRIDKESQVLEFTHPVHSTYLIIPIRDIGEAGGRAASFRLIGISRFKQEGTRQHNIAYTACALRHSVFNILGYDLISALVEHGNQRGLAMLKYLIQDDPVRDGTNYRFSLTSEEANQMNQETYSQYGISYP